MSAGRGRAELRLLLLLPHTALGMCAGAVGHTRHDGVQGYTFSGKAACLPWSLQAILSC